MDFPLSQEEIDSTTELTKSALEKAHALTQAITELQEYLEENHVAISIKQEKEIHEAMWHVPSKIFSIGKHRIKVAWSTPARVLADPQQDGQGAIPGLV